MLNAIVENEWQTPRDDLAIDHDGPTDTAFERFDDSAIERPIIEIFNQVAARHGDKLATVDETTSLTYRELQRAANHLARRIDALVPPGKPVGLLLPSTALFPVAALACLAAGRPYVPIDPSYPSTRIEGIREEAGLAAMVIDRIDGKVFYDGDLLPCLDIGTSLDSAADELPPVAVAGVPAVILYTSGSTGRPKGICNDQRAILQRVVQATHSCHLSANDRCFLLSSPGTIAGVRETFAALLNGATLYVADPNRLGINGVLQMFGDSGITVGYIVPALLRQLMAAPQAGAAFAQARVIRIGGDIPVKDDLALCRAILPASCHILFAFSSTEIPTIFQWFVPKNWQPDAVRLPIGYARPGMDYRIEADGEDGAGELIVRSRYLALGYWQGGKLQNGPFQTDPADPQLRILRTGDRVRMRPDGLVEMTGRTDRQIKMRGVRVDLAEVELALRGCAGVADAAVIPRCQNEDVIALVAYVVAHDAPSPAFEADLRAGLGKLLPRRMCPAQFRILDALPQLQGFKTDYPALALLDQRELAQSQSNIVDEAVSAPSLVPSASPNHARIRDAVAQAWTTVVGRKSFLADVRWDEAGGDSLDALHLWCLIEQTLGQRLVIKSLELHATPTMLIAEVERQLSTSQPVASMAPRVFFLPSADGDTPLQAQFRAAFHNQVRFEVVSYPPWRDMINAGGDFGVLIAAAVDQILAAGDGDIRLAGFSFGGFVASEVARRLIALNRRVSFVGLIDTHFGFRLQLQQSRLAMVGSLVRKILLEPASLEVTVVKFLARRSAFTILRRLGELATRLPAKAAFRCQYHLNYHLRVQAMYRWAVQPVDAPIYVFRTDEFPESSVRSSWGPLARHLEVISVGGTHLSILRPPAREHLCRQFLKAVNGARQTADVPTAPAAAE